MSKEKITVSVEVEIEVTEDTEKKWFIASGPRWCAAGGPTRTDAVALLTSMIEEQIEALIS